MTQVFISKGIFANNRYDGELVGRPNFAGLGTDIWGKYSTGSTSNPVGYNDNHKNDAGREWSTTIPFSSNADKVTFSKLVYCFQHKMEKALKIPECTGNCTPDVKAGDCYNRDGMIGKRTLELIGHIKAGGDMAFTGSEKAQAKSFAATMTIPQSFIKKYSEFQPASDVAPHIANGEGTAGQVHNDLTGGKKKSTKKGITEVSFWNKEIFGIKYKIVIPGILGVAALAATAIYASDVMGTNEDIELKKELEGLWF